MTLGAPLLLQVSDLQFGFDGQPPLFSGLSFALPAGVHRLDGESGSGKTTLLQLQAGTLQGRGRLALDGQPLQAAPGGAPGARVAWVDARDPAFDTLTPEALMQQLRPAWPAFDANAWQQHIDGFGLAPHGFKTLHMLSTGMRRKAALAAVLASGCPLVLLDEPTAGLDGPSTAHLVAALNRLGRSGRCVVLVVLGHWPDGLDCGTTLALAGA